MRMLSGERWHCTNPPCQCEVLVEKESTEASAHPSCICGGALKKKYAAPVFRYLDFLRADEPVVPASAREE